MTAIETDVPVTLPSTEADCFPFVIVRIAAGAFDALPSLDLHESPSLAADVRAFQATAAAIAGLLREELYEVIGGCEDVDLRRLLLRARRDLFNGRRLDARTVASLAAAFGPRLPNLGTYADAMRDVDAAERLFAGTFATEVAGARRALSALAGAEELQRPLVLSSEVFLSQLRRYARRAEGPPSGKELDVERTLMKYLSRMHAKTSPFSTFCHVAIGRLVDAAEPLSSGHAAWDAEAAVRINNNVWQLLRPYLLDFRPIADHFRLRVNPSLTKSHDQLRFLINIRNVESFQSLPAAEGLETIVSLAADGPTRAMLVDRVVSADLVDGTREDVATFVHQLIDHGLLEFDLSVSGIDPDWDRELAALLAPLAATCDAAKSVIERLDSLRAAASEFGRANADGRLAVLKRCSEHIAAAREALTVAREAEELSGGPAQSAGDTLTEDATRAVDDAVPSGGAVQVISVSTVAKGLILPNHTLLLEDSAVRDELAVDRGRMAAIGDSMSHLMTRVAFTDGLAPGRRQLLHYFRARYGDDAKVPLIRLYENYFRDCKVPEAEARKAGRHEPVDYPGSMEFRLEAARNEKAVKMWSTALAARLEKQITNERVYVEREDLDAVHGLGPPVLDSRLPQATAAYLQLADDSIDGRIAVLNSTGPGYGKTINRFFHLFPPELTDSQRMANLGSAGASRLAEVLDASFNNANLHPPLLDCEISSPGAHTSLSPEQQLPASSLEVSLNGEGELELTHVRTAARVEILDLGLQANITRSQMFQLLFSGFGRSKHLGCYPVVTAANLAWNLSQPQVTGAEVIVQPRVVYDRRIVLRRRSWLIQADRLPVRQRSEGDAAFFARIDGWRERNGIPMYVYAFVAQEPDLKSAKRARDDYKPQFLSFRSPFSVSLLEAQIRQMKHPLRLEEMLPLSDSMMLRHGRQHAAEYVLQWTRRAS